jgi:hypothetical protein
MKVQILMFLISLVLLVGLTNCSNDCESKPASCNEKPPKDEPCDAAFNRWFYNKENNICEQINYSGCSQKGFSTQKECEECLCK